MRKATKSPYTGEFPIQFVSLYQGTGSSKPQNKGIGRDRHYPIPFISKYFKICFIPLTIEVHSFDNRVYCCF